MQVLDLKMGDVVKYGIWRQIISIKEEHWKDCNVSYRTLYFEDGTNEIFNIYERLEIS